MRRIEICSVLFAWLALVPTAQAESRWLDDTLISPSGFGTDRVGVDVKEDNSTWYALVSPRISEVLHSDGPRGSDRCV